MIVLNKPIKNLTFEEIAKFCEEKIIEGIQIEYKKEFPAKGLAKQITAFSNTRGGIIIIGVKENEDSGVPELWDGIQNEGKLIERVHQYAFNVEPPPSYEVSVTNEVNGKVFLLIRIFEGNETPYFVQNNSNIWIRSGNISQPISNASPEKLKSLFAKRDQAEIAREVNLNTADNTCDALISREQIKTQTQPIITSDEISANKSMREFPYLKIIFQPFFPDVSFKKPSELKSSIQHIHVNSKYQSEFPNYNQETIQYGIASINYLDTSRRYSCEQIYGNGLIFFEKNFPNTEKKQFHISTVGNFLYLMLQSAKSVYNYLRFQGTIMGYILISKIGDLEMQPITLRQSPPSFIEPHEPLFGAYSWSVETDTNKLSCETELDKFFINTMNEILVSLNFPAGTEDFFQIFLKEVGWK